MSPERPPVIQETAGRAGSDSMTSRRRFGIGIPGVGAVQAGSAVPGAIDPSGKTRRKVYSLSNHSRRFPPMSSRPRRLALALTALLLLGADRPGKTLDIYFIDVMGGAATLIVTPERESLLIDSGWPGFDDRDPKRIAHVIRDVAGLDGLDHVAITHWHR